MNEYVAGGWAATAGILALYTWRVIHRGRVLSRALPPPPAGPPPEPARDASAGARGEVRAWP